MLSHLPRLARQCWRLALVAVLAALLATPPGPRPAMAGIGHGAHAVTSAAPDGGHHAPEAIASPRPMPAADHDPRDCHVRACISTCCILTTDLPSGGLATPRQAAHLVHHPAAAPEPKGLGPEVAVPPPRTFS